MGKRYGRNQKRTHRQRIKALEQAYSCECHLLGALRNENRHLESILQDVRECLGENFVGLPPEKIQINLRRLAAERSLSWRIPYPRGGASMPALTVHALLLEEKRTQLDPYEMQMHWTVSLADGTCAYALTERALFDAPVEILARHISHQLAAHLIELLRRRREELSCSRQVACTP